MAVGEALVAVVQVVVDTVAAVWVGADEEVAVLEAEAQGLAETVRAEEAMVMEEAVKAEAEAGVKVMVVVEMAAAMEAVVVLQDRQPAREEVEMAAATVALVDSETAAAEMD